MHTRIDLATPNPYLWKAALNGYRPACFLGACNYAHRLLFHPTFYRDKNQSCLHGPEQSTYTIYAVQACTFQKHFFSAKKILPGLANPTHVTQKVSFPPGTRITIDPVAYFGHVTHLTSATVPRNAHTRAHTRIHTYACTFKPLSLERGARPSFLPPAGSLFGRRAAAGSGASGYHCPPNGAPLSRAGKARAAPPAEGRYRTRQDAPVCVKGL